MPTVAWGSANDFSDLTAVHEALAAHHPGCAFGAGQIDEGGPHQLRAPEGRVRFFWIAQGRGTVQVPRGHRTQEGDGTPLPPSYQPEPLPEEAQEHLAALRRHAASCHPRIRPAVDRLLSRFREGMFIGDMAGDLWELADQGIPEAGWSPRADVVAALRYLVRASRKLGWSTKTGATSWESIGPGDQLVATDEDAVTVQGRLRYWWMDVDPWDDPWPSISRTRRLEFVRDTAGGCNPSFDAYRRLLTCWRLDRPEANRVNSHVVHIAAATSTTHYHPTADINGGFGQGELYLVLDPADRGLRPASERALLHIYPDLDDLSRFETLVLNPGDAVYIPPGTGHRGADVFVNVVAVPGFRPQNEFPLDVAIAETVGDSAPYNRALAVQPQAG